MLRTLSDTNFFTNFRWYEPYAIRTLSCTNICIRTLAYEPFAIRTFSLTNFCIRTVCLRTLSVTNFLNTNLIPYELFTLRTFAVTNFLPYEHYPIRTSADEHLLTNIFPYEPCVYELSSGYPAHFSFGLGLIKHFTDRQNFSEQAARPVAQVSACVTASTASQPPAESITKPFETDPASVVVVVE